MNVLQDCKNELARIGRTLTQMLQIEAQPCQCESQETKVSTSEVSTCSCGQDACQIGDGPNACRPQTHTITEQA
jgi:hypothetical protein